ncbi:hypothetical protein HS088_TW17G00127 [Tripterygium wilfordii]|uniref:Cathepsin propeptide inhibitor domain-containing protein n=1 Tax=Tripterygium wilfordii TaxID=458696 RepID=A0A7J7CFE0_TRIWF|nr:hypothetical protein HS088_TW17G00127 [Tripterygium wilfordii]
MKQLGYGVEEEEEEEEGGGVSQRRKFSFSGYSTRLDPEKLTMLRLVGLMLLIVWLLSLPSEAWSGISRPSADDPENIRERYENWLARHGRTYKGEDEWQLRFKIYKANVQFIDYINSQNYSFKLTDNQFADMTSEEFKTITRRQGKIIEANAGYQSKIKSNDG